MGDSVNGYDSKCGSEQLIKEVHGMLHDTNTLIKSMSDSVQAVARTGPSLVNTIGRLAEAIETQGNKHDRAPLYVLAAAVLFLVFWTMDHYGIAGLERAGAAVKNITD